MPATYADLRAQLKAILRSWGMPEDNAEITAEVLAWSDPHGVDSHGISMIPRYDQLRRNGRVRMDARPQIVAASQCHVRRKTRSAELHGPEDEVPTTAVFSSITRSANAPALPMRERKATTSLERADNVVDVRVVGSGPFSCLSEHAGQGSQSWVA
jgi:hypothetical protein